MIGEYLAEGAIAPLVMIKRGRYKFVHSPVDPDQLYDLAEDPEESRISQRRLRIRRACARFAPRWGGAGIFPLCTPRSSTVSVAGISSTCAA